MKLNLLPTTVSKASASKGAAIGAVILGLLGVGAAVGMIFISNTALNTAREEAIVHQKPAADAVATAQQARVQMDSANTIIRNQMLSEAMLAHNDVYPDLYTEVMRYVPAYYRLTSLSATPAGETTVISMTGQLDTFSQYADLAIALWKIPDALDVARAGYVNDDKRVPNLSEGDQVGAPIGPSDSPLPSDPLQRLDALIARANSEPTGYLNVGGFGSTDTVSARGATPGYSTVSMTVTVQRDVRVPDPRATINSGGGAPAAGGFGGAPQGFGGGPVGAPLSAPGRDSDR